MAEFKVFCCCSVDEFRQLRSCFARVTSMMPEFEATSSGAVTSPANKTISDEV